MADFVETLNLGRLLAVVPEYTQGTNFEEFYGRLVETPERQALARELADRIFAYFSRLNLPPQPTLYDHLVLSLRPKDLVATFNWDPFLAQAIIRNQSFAPMPKAVFLHGNVAVAYCTRHERVGMGSPGGVCRICGEGLELSTLLFPVSKKNYSSDPAIAAAWRVVHSYLEDAACVTFFGYGAPVSDVEAVDLLKKGWGSPDERQMEETEVIDVASTGLLRQKWSAFIHSHHYRIETNFYDSIAGRSPRRSAEQLFKAHFLGQFITEFPLPKDATWDELRGFLEPLIKQEKQPGKPWSENE